MDKNQINVDNIIERLVAVRGSKPGKTVNLSEAEIRGLLIKTRQLLLSQPMLLHLGAPVKIVGDIHGQYFDLLRIFSFFGYPPNANYLFLGDYVDRGQQGIQTFCLLICYKLKYPQNFFILRGNHESQWISKHYGFYDQCKRRYSIDLWKVFTQCFHCLPIAAVIDEKIFCVHGGLSPELQSIQLINQIQRPTEIPDKGLLCDLLWSDPQKSHKGWGESPRGISYTFGQDVALFVIQKFKLDLICRGHQVVSDGYQFFANRKLATIFSAPNYMGAFDNSGGVLSVNQQLVCSFQVLKPSDLVNSHTVNAQNRPGTPNPPR